MERKGDRLFCTDVGVRLQIGRQERRISSHHKQLEGLYEDVLCALDRSGVRAAANAYHRFADALDAHMLLEEEVYFPALNDLLPDVGKELCSLARDHEMLRELAGLIRGHFDAGERSKAARRLPELAIRISEHEVAEEALISRISSVPTADNGHSTPEE